MSKPDVLLVSPEWHPEALRVLNARYAVHDWAGAPDRDALLAEVGPRIKAVATDGMSGVANAVLDRLPALEIVGNNGVGYDKVDVPYCAARGVKVCNTPGVLNEAVAELTLALMLAHARRVPDYHVYARAGRWAAEGTPPFTAQLSGARAGIIGLGRIGKAIATRCEAMGMSVAYHGRTDQGLAYPYHPTAAGLAAAVDWLITILPATPETTGMINAEVLAALGPQGVYVNVGRGALHDEPALIEALASGRLGGAALDVFADEPNIPAALREAETVTLSPHMGSATHVTRIGMGQLVIDNFDAHFAGEALPTEVTA
ncbi:MAG: 2-hydroxyacid dehydrogenase [Pseudomonadota bacterium]